MTRDTRGVLAAIDRWRSKELIDDVLAGALRAEVASASASETRRVTQLLVALTAGTALLIAGALFLDWAWPLMTDPARATLLALLGIAVVAVGVRLETGAGWLPAAQSMQAAGLGLLLAAFIYSKEAWADMSPGGLVVGGLSFVVPVVLAPRAMRRSVVMPAVHLVAGLAFLAVFLDRATPLDADGIVWALDVVLLLSMSVLLRLLASDPSGERHPWALNAFVTALLAGFVLVAATGAGPLSMDENVVWPLNFWLLLTVGLTHGGIHGAPPGLRRDWFARVLACCMLIWIVLGFATVHGALDGPSELALVLVGGAGVVGFLYGDRHRMRELLGTSALAFIAALWAWAVDRAGALGAVVALAVTATGLFWISSKVRSGEPAD